MATIEKNRAEDEATARDEMEGRTPSWRRGLGCGMTGRAPYGPTSTPDRAPPT